MIKGCIFDLDGVIVDTAKYHYLAWKRLANELGFEFTEKDNERLKGVSRMKSLEILLEIGNKKFDEETKLKLAEKKNGWYVEYISKMDESEILDGVKAFLTELREKGIKISLGSVSKNAMTILKNINLLPYFDAVIDGTKVANAKPDPEVFLKAAEELKLKPEECCVFEDAVAGIEAARRANMKVIGVGSPEILGDADKVIDTFKGVTIDILNF
ncbi:MULTISPECIES: beta-phosphoglucomutase [Caloramator]|uniref:Beta-phosphoglucomutase n=1 Tax=Caloramator proteoclasticus DSM 10124 TaxID=1121262 RepID=A0A1M4TWP7_9CLOT|nr:MULTISPECIES: beta-phosphoglucomutase [Caloramator]SHE48866.1 beta-phosphoglucomutase [Caloramator proteoclasticus DSM 10124]